MKSHVTGVETYEDVWMCCHVIRKHGVFCKVSVVGVACCKAISLRVASMVVLMACVYYNNVPVTIWTLVMTFLYSFGEVEAVVVY